MGDDQVVAVLRAVRDRPGEPAQRQPGEFGAALAFLLAGTGEETQVEVRRLGGEFGPLRQMGHVVTGGFAGVRGDALQFGGDQACGLLRPWQGAVVDGGEGDVPQASAEQGGLAPAGVRQFALVR